MPKDPFQPVDDAARAQARALIDGADHAALAVLQPGTNLPSVTRIALATSPDGAPLTLVSDLAPHTAALASNPACALLVGAVQGKGDPLTHPRLTLHATAQFIARDSAEHGPTRAHRVEGRGIEHEAVPRDVPRRQHEAVQE